MAKNYDATDFLWTSRGDIFIADGDIKDTEEDPLRSVVQEIKTRASGDQGDWKMNVNVGSNISSLVGQPNNKETAEHIKTRIISALTRHGFIKANDLSIRYMPISREKLLVRISLSVAPTSKNKASEQLKITGLYNYKEDQVALLI